MEPMTVVTKSRPNPTYPLTWKTPQDFRRACIKKAFGMIKSWYSNYQKWLHNKEKHEEKQSKKLIAAQKQGRSYNPKKFNLKPPVPPQNYQNLHPVFYSGMYEKFNGESIMLKLWTGKAWIKMKQPLELSGRKLPDGYEWGSPTVVLKDSVFNLHFAILKQVKAPEKLVDQANNSTSMRICSVDLNLDGDIAVASILDCDDTGTVIESANLFVKGNDNIQHRRKRQLGLIATAYRRTNKGFGGAKIADCSQRWRKIKNRDDYESHRISKRIVDFAISHNATVIVFECLINLRPDKAKYSRRSNQKRAYWLSSKIVRRTKYKAFQKHSIITSLVSPKNTSRHCALCLNQQDYEEYDLPLISRIEAQFNTDMATYFNIVLSEGIEKVSYTAGAPNYICSNTILHRGNADLNAARNIGLRFFARYYQKPWLKVERLGLSAIHGEVRLASGKMAA